MRLSLKQVKKMNVETVSHKVLGSVVDVILDVENHVVVQYCVKSGVISGHQYLIHPRQIVRFEKNKMIVEDSVVGTTELAPPLPEAAMQ